ncbi:ATP-binding protein [Candidatus Woesearchaeota archaeon]|nr:ATP-binding protein [Candidatus Woesearchaeota archaeon]
MSWYKKFRFDNNPLDVRPNPNLVGLEEEEEKLVNFIRKGDVCFLNGLTGSGKTSLLQRVKERLGNNYSFIYLNAEDLPENFNLEEEIKKKRSFFDIITFRQAPKNLPVLMIDEFQATDPNLILEAKGKWENTHERKVRSIVVSQIKNQLRNASGSFKDRLGKRVVSLTTLDDDYMKDILKMRLYNKRNKTNLIDKFEPEALALLIRCANSSVRRLLEYSDMIFDFHHTKFEKNNPLVKSPDYKITFHGVKEILTVNNVSVRGFVTETEKVDETKPIEELFGKQERRILRLLLAYESNSTERISKKLNMPLDKARKIISILGKKKAIVSKEKKERSNVWELTPHTKRLMVKY